ncbi:RNA-directed DNA polymerase, eukaryota [Tanacetum coccineum]
MLCQMTLQNHNLNLCQSYGTVVDVYIPNRRSKAGKRFAFVRFINVDNIERLVGNLCTLWIGKMHLQANVVRFERSPLQSSRPPPPPKRPAPPAPSYISAAKGILNTPLSATSAMVLDDTCLVTHVLDNYVMGEVTEFSSINNLRVLLSNEGFSNTRIAYLGGQWVTIELPSATVKAKFMKHVGVASWFNSLSKVDPGFVPRDRIVWVDIEGVPMHAWSCNTFRKICSKWGEALDLEENHREGKIYVIRAEELFVWSPSFTDIVENDYTSDNDVEIDSGVKHSAPVHQVNSGEESEDEVISEMFFGENADTVGEANVSAHKVSSHDPFNIYDLLHKKPKAVEKEPTSSSIPFPPGFTPEGGTPVQNAHKTQEDHDQSVGKSNGCSSRIAECTQKVDEQLSSKSFDNDRKKLEGGSILGILEEMIKVGQTMGFSMDGCANDMEKIIGTQGVDGETKSDNISDMAIKNLWGNSLFEDVVSEANGNSGGILCVWDPRFFHKDHHIISDNFIALYGTWSPNQTKLLLISVYAPQAVSLKRILWSYLTSLINRWNGECIVMGDFNEVRRKEDRWGTSFNVFRTRVFNQFISSAGLVEIQLEGYNFTWAHPSASKMSKLDRFLVSDGLLSIFPHLSAVCLDRHLSDHRPILLREVNVDYGATPFRFFHSWINFPDNASNLMELREEIVNQLQNVQNTSTRDFIQKAKIQWAVEGDENSKFFHGIVNRKRASLAVKGVMINGEWVDEPNRVKEEFRNHFASRFNDPGPRSGFINHVFPNQLNADQVSELEKPISKEEIRLAVWGCGENKSPGPDGFTFEFFRKFWDVVGMDFCIAVEWFFEHAYFPVGYGPFILNDLLAHCHRKKHWALVFKVDFAKAYDSVRWDYLEDVLISFGFGHKWRSWIRGSLHSSMASILVNGSPSTEFKIHRGLKQGDPLAPYLFILIMESLHLSFSRVIEAGSFTGIKIDSSVTLSHLFYADDAIFIGEWSRDNLKCIMHVLHCFSLLSGLSLNLKKSQLLGVGIPDSTVSLAADMIGCSVLHTPFKYLGIPVGGNMNSIKAWDDIIYKIKKRLSNWKLNTLSIGGRLTLLKSVLGSTPLYYMSLYKVPKTVLHSMESIRRNFFNGIREGDRKISWISWPKVLASRENGGLGVSSFYALNRGLLAKWMWRFLSNENSLWVRFIKAAHEDNTHSISAAYPSAWNTIIKELQVLKSLGFDFFSHCKIRIGNGCNTSFWKDPWIGDSRLCLQFPRLYALENNKECTVAVKMSAPFTFSFRWEVRGGIESSQLSQISELLGTQILSSIEDRW